MMHQWKIVYELSADVDMNVGNPRRYKTVRATTKEKALLLADKHREIGEDIVSVHYIGPQFKLVKNKIIHLPDCQTVCTVEDNPTSKKLAKLLVK